VPAIFRPATGRTRTGPGNRDHVTGASMSLLNRLESLKGRHASLEERISDEDHRPRPDSDALMRLKLEKLRLKEEMHRLQLSEGEH
jgi:hypothetical protein